MRRGHHIEPLTRDGEVVCECGGNMDPEIFSPTTLDHDLLWWRCRDFPQHVSASIPLPDGFYVRPAGYNASVIDRATRRVQQPPLERSARGRSRSRR